MFQLNDESEHKYLYENNNIYFIITDNEDVEKKYITLCEKLDSCNFIYQNQKLETSIKINDITYHNDFTI